MGRHRRRGTTATWLPTHLADAQGRVSPHSFLLALKHAETYSRENGAEEILHYEGLLKGVQVASHVRSQELMEDYPWVEAVLAPLKDLSVPCNRKELIHRWQEAQVVATIMPLIQAEDRSWLPPYILVDRPEAPQPEAALIEVLVELGVLSYLTDDRLNMPDIFRVAAGIGRKGGVQVLTHFSPQMEN